MVHTGFTDNASLGARRLVRALMREELDRLARRAGVDEYALPVRVHAPGVVSIEDDGLPVRLASFFGVHRALSLVYNGGGMNDVVMRLGTDQASKRPMRRNSGTHVQVGDTFSVPMLELVPRKRTVQAIILPGADATTMPSLATWDAPGARVVLASRIAPSIEAALSDLPRHPVPASRERAEMLDLKRLRAQAGAALARKVAEVRRGLGWDTGLIALCAIGNAIEGMALDRLAKRKPDAAEAVLLRAHVRGLDRLREAIAAPYGSVTMPGMLLAMVSEERTAATDRLREVYRSSNALRREARAKGCPAAERTA